MKTKMKCLATLCFFSASGLAYGSEKADMPIPMEMPDFPPVPSIQDQAMSDLPRYILRVKEALYQTHIQFVRHAHIDPANSDTELKNEVSTTLRRIVNEQGIDVAPGLQVAIQTLLANPRNIQRLCERGQIPHQIQVQTSEGLAYFDFLNPHKPLPAGATLIETAALNIETIGDLLRHELSKMLQSGH
jgi:hypothetical protein